MTNFSLDIPKMGYILAVKKLPKEFFGNRIKAVQKKHILNKEAIEYTHVEILGGGPDSVRIALPKTKPIDITKVYKGRYVKILRLKNATFPEYQEKYRYKIAFFYAQLCNLRYDKAGILSFIIGWIKQNKNLFFCSEGVCTSIQKVYPYAFNNCDPSRCMPAHIVASNQVETVWEGIIP